MKLGDVTRECTVRSLGEVKVGDLSRGCTVISLRGGEVGWCI